MITEGGRDGHHFVQETVGLGQIAPPQRRVPYRAQAIRHPVTVVLDAEKRQTLAGEGCRLRHLSLVDQEIGIYLEMKGQDEVAVSQSAEFDAKPWYFTDSACQRNSLCQGGRFVLIRRCLCRGCKLKRVTG